MAGGEPRFGMLETIREYALERLDERGDGEVVRRRHAGFYVLLAEQAEPALRGPEQVSWLDRLDAELANIRAALTWATESGEAEIGLRIGAALWRFWHMRGSLAEGRDRLERLLALNSGSSAPGLRRSWRLPRSRTSRATTKPCVVCTRQPADPARAGRRSERRNLTRRPDRLHRCDW